MIARRPWSGPWSSTIVPVSAIPTRASVTTASIRSRSAAGRPSSTTAPGTSTPRPGGTTTDAPAGSAAATAADRASAGHRVDDRAVVGDPLDEQRDQVDRRVGGTPRRRRHLGGCRPVDVREGGADPGQDLVAGAHRRPPSVPRCVRCHQARNDSAWRRGQVPGSGPGGGGPGQPSGRAPTAGQRRTAEPAEQPAGQSRRPLRAGRGGARRRRRTPRPSSPRPRPWGPGRRGARRRPARAGATSTVGDVDADRADLEAGPAQRGGVGQRVGLRVAGPR